MTQVTNLACLPRSAWPFFRIACVEVASEALGAALAALVEPHPARSGCLNYDLHRSVDDADVWFVYENWRSPEGLDAHMLSEHLQTFLKGNARSRRRQHRSSAVQDDLEPRNAPHLKCDTFQKLE